MSTDAYVNACRKVAEARREQKAARMASREALTRETDTARALEAAYDELHQVTEAQIGEGCLVY